MTWQIGATMDALVTFLAAIPGIQSVRKGEPTTIPTSVTAFVKVGAMPFQDRQTSDLVKRDGELLVWIGYKVLASTADVEDTLADVVDELQKRFLVERKTGKLGNTVESMELDTLAASAADYAKIGGQEFRLYPLTIKFTQSHTIP